MRVAKAQLSAAEVPVFTLILLLVLLWIVLTVLLSAWSLWFQGYLYSEPTTGIQWRGPAAGSALMVVLIFWLMLDYRSPGRYRPLFESTSSENVAPFTELRIPKAGGGEEVYRLRPRTREYRLDGKPNGKLLPGLPSSITVVEDGEKFTFEPERDAKGNFKRGAASSWFGSSQSDDLRYIDGKGRVMLESSIGQVATFHGGWLLGNLVVHIVFLAVWFVALWLLLRFQWPHALGQAFVFWGVMLIFVLPPVLTRAEEVAKQRAEAKRLA